MRKFLRLNATTKASRHLMIEAAKDAIAASGGWILDFKQFSNLSATISFELPLENLMAFRDALSKIDLQVSESGLLAIGELAEQETAPAKLPADLNATLQITFIHNEPDLRIPVPMIPG